eukprot:860539-Alexandrium_andersonii.AAC.1
MNGYIKVLEDKVALFEEQSGLAGIFCRCIAGRRPTTNDPPPAIRWVPRRAAETGPDYLARVLSMRQSGIAKGDVRCR